MPLYAEAARQLLGCDCLGGVFHRVGRSKKLQEHYFARMRFIRGRYAEVDDYEDLLSKVLARVGEFLQAMREGRFDVMPTADCPSYCPFRQICHYSPARDEVKRPPKTEGEEGATAPKSDPLTESKPRPEVQPPADRSGKQKKKVDNRDKGGAKR